MIPRRHVAAESSPAASSKVCYSGTRFTPISKEALSDTRGNVEAMTVQLEHHKVIHAKAHKIIRTVRK